MSESADILQVYRRLAQKIRRDAFLDNPAKFIDEAITRVMEVSGKHSCIVGEQ